jgi:hypothetical protein
MESSFDDFISLINIKLEYDVLSEPENLLNCYDKFGVKLM